MLTIQRISLLLVLALPFLSSAQHNTGETVPYRLKTIPWSVGLGVNAVNNDSKPDGFFGAGQSFNFLPAPSRLAVLYHFNDYMELEGALTVNRYTAYRKYYDPNSTVTVYVNDTAVEVPYTPPAAKSAMFFALDVHAQFSLPGLNAKTKNFFKPYLAIGPGVTLRQGFGVVTTTNVGLGFYSWFTYNWGVQFQSMAKLANAAPFFDNGGNYMQHSFTIMYHLGGDPKNNNNFSKSKHPGVKKKYKFKPDKKST